MEHFNWTQLIPAVGHEYIHIATLIVGCGVLALFGLIGRLALGSGEMSYIPSSRFGIKGIFEAVTEFIISISDLVIGAEDRRFVPMFVTIFLLVFVNNFFALLPGWTPATDDLNTTLALGLFIFAIYNYYGIREHGGHYIQQFLGPLLPLAPFMFCVELISHLVRPLSLGLRLKWNMAGDHILLGVFYNLSEAIHGILVPVPLMFLGLLVCFMQSFVFVMMGMIYVSMAISHDH